jgi:hypothetical protein
MCQRFMINRRKFADLIYSMECFDEQEIVEKFRKSQNGDIVIDGSQTVSQYLRDLRDQGALKYVGGKYFVRGHLSSKAKTPLQVAA